MLGAVLFWEDGYFTSSVLTLLYVATVYYWLRRARAGMELPAIRKINGLEAFDEAIGRATEMGRPVHFTPGSVTFSAIGFASFAVLSHVARLTARYDTRLIVTCRNYIIHTVLDEIVRQSYLEAGRPDAYNPDDVRFLSTFQFAYAGAVLGIYVREQVAASFMIGYFYAESLIFAEAGYQIGAIQIAGTTNTSQTPFFIAACDYCLIGEEIFAAGAYLSRDPLLTGTVIAQDKAKIVVTALIVLGTIGATAGFADAIYNLLTL